MCYAYDGRKVAPKNAGDKDRDTLMERVPQIDLNKGMETGNKYGSIRRSIPGEWGGFGG